MGREALCTARVGNETAEATALLESTTVVLRGALPLRHAERLRVIVDGRALPVSLSDADCWTLLALSGGRPLDLAGEWDGQAFAPLTAWAGDGAPLWLRSAS